MFLFLLMLVFMRLLYLFSLFIIKYVLIVFPMCLFLLMFYLCIYYIKFLFCLLIMRCLNVFPMFSVVFLLNLKCLLLIFLLLLFLNYVCLNDLCSDVCVCRCFIYVCLISCFFLFNMFVDVCPMFCFCWCLNCVLIICCLLPLLFNSMFFVCFSDVSVFDFHVCVYNMFLLFCLFIYVLLCVCFRCFCFMLMCFVCAYAIFRFCGCFNHVCFMCFIMFLFPVIVFISVIIKWLFCFLQNKFYVRFRCFCFVLMFHLCVYYTCSASVFYNIVRFMRVSDFCFFVYLCSYYIYVRLLLLFDYALFNVVLCFFFSFIYFLIISMFCCCV